MADMGVVEADDKQAEFRQGEPHWHLALEHAGPVVGIALVVTGKGLRVMQKPQQRGVRLLLRHAVQI